MKSFSGRRTSGTYAIALMICRPTAGKKWRCHENPTLDICYNSMVNGDLRRLNQTWHNIQGITQTWKPDLCVYHWGNENPPNEVLLALTPLYPPCRCRQGRQSSEYSGDIIEAESCLNQQIIYIPFRGYRELLIRRDSVTMKFHFKNKLKTRWSKSAECNLNDQPLPLLIGKGLGFLGFPYEWK